MNDNPEDAFGPLLAFLVAEIEKDQRITDEQLDRVVDRLEQLPVRERQLIQEAAVTGYTIGYLDRHGGLSGQTNSKLVTARAVDRCLQEPDGFVAVNSDPDEYAEADRLNQRLTRELKATQRAKQENDERFQLERDQARMERDELRRYVDSLNLKTD